MATSTETTDLAVIEKQTGELQVTHAEASAQHEIQSAIVIARKYPRNEDHCFGALMKACRRRTFALRAEYKFPRGGKQVTGASVQLAREAARIWGNIRFGLSIVHDDETSRTIRGWAWDVQTNTKIEADDSFQKLVQRKNNRTNTTEWVKPDERDLRELTNKRGAVCVRNCLLQLMPPDLIEDAITEARKAAASEVADDIDKHRKQIINAFAGLHVTVEDLEGYLDHELRLCTPEEVVDLQKVYASIRDGNSIWSDHVGGSNGDAETSKKARKSKLNDELKPDDKPSEPAEEKPDATDWESIDDALDATTSTTAVAEIEHRFRDAVDDPVRLKKMVDARKKWLREETSEPQPA